MSIINRGKDGKFYDDVNDMIAADNRWDQQEEQNQLLEQQNMLLAKQLSDSERLAREKMENEIAIETSRQNHDKEMRLLSLCDEIGISKKLIDNYLEYLLSTNDGLKKEEKEEIDKLNSKYEKNEEKLSEFDDNDTDELEVWNELKLLNKTHLDKINDEDVIQLFNDSTNSFNTGLILFVVGFIILFLFVFMMGEDDATNTILLLVGISPMCASIFLLIKYCIINGNIKKKCEEKIEELSNNEVESVEDERTAKIRKEQVDLEEKIHAIVQKNISRKINKFNKFRIDHYNAQFEKFLLDIDFEKKIHRYGSFIDIDYQTITKSKSNGSGEIDDYIEFFNDHIND